MKRNFTIDLLKAISIILVVLVHSLPREVQMLIGRPLFLQHAVPVFMILFGYNRVKSIERKGLEEIADLFKWEYIWKQVKGILNPYFFIWLLFELSFSLALNKRLIDMTQSFVMGGRGPGGYFIVLMIQAIIFFPFLYTVMNRFNPFKVLMGVFFVNLALETMSANMDPELYRVLILRHLFSIALGVYLAKREHEINILKWLPLVILSLVYIISVDYGGAYFGIEHMWDSQHAPAYFWTFFLVYLALKLPIKENALVTKVGQSSYFIFLVQKVYFMFRNEFFSGISFGTDTLISLTISISLGISFYYLAKNNYYIDDIKKVQFAENR